MKHVGKSINKFRKIQDVSIPLIAKRTGIKMAALNDFMKGKTLLTKKDRKAICKAINIPPAVIVNDCLEATDVAKNKRALFKAISPTLNKMIVGLLKDEAKKKKK